MGVTYRTLGPDEESAVLDIWATTLNHDRAMIERRWLTDPQYRDRTHVAIAADGQVLGAISYFLRQVRDATGTAQQFGHVFYVAMHVDAQHQGHGRELMTQVIAAMQHDGCLWGAVSAAVQARGFYERTGWHLSNTPWQQGTVTAEAFRLDTSYQVDRYDPITAPEGWDPLRLIYAV